MVTGGGGGDSGREKLGWGLGKVEEVPRKVLARGIELWWPEEGDRRKGAMAERVLERSSPLVVVRRRREDMTGGSHNQNKFKPTVFWRTVRRSLADRRQFSYVLHFLCQLDSDKAEFTPSNEFPRIPPTKSTSERQDPFFRPATRTIESRKARTGGDSPNPEISAELPSKSESTPPLGHGRRQSPRRPNKKPNK